MKKYYSELIQSNPEWRFCGVFADEAITGTKESRPEFQKMLAECNGVKNSIVTPNEARRKLDMSNAEGGDRLYANGNVIPLEKAGVQYAEKDGQQTTEEDDVKGGEGNAEDEKV